MRVHLDAGICQGHNRCRALAPEVFDVDEFGQAVQRIDDELPAGLEARTRLAAANRPEYAISLTG
jgi:ferredoxin